ncbi:MAG TPA: Rieske 2Fe-2S domain-containing protein [Stellaceae bacterium]|nr:Rieske 2Fe-2S domain-containing protein [Stellaceae bacterium]
MAQEQSPPRGPDLTQGVALTEITGEMLIGHIGAEEILVVRDCGEFFAIDAHCSHYHGPLLDGLVVGGTTRASTSLRTRTACAIRSLGANEH